MRIGTRALAALITLPVAAGLALAACGDQPDPDRTVWIGITEPSSLLPADTDEKDGAQVLAALFTPLVRFDDRGRPEPLAAESIEPSEGGRVWTVVLREGVTFHNGEPVTADSYLNAWNYGAYQPNQQRNNYYFGRIEGYRKLNPGDGQEPAGQRLDGLAKVDDRTFTVTLAEPFGDFPAMLGAPAFYPLPRAAFAEDGVLREEFARAPIGNGPFRLVGEWQPGTPITVERYEENVLDPPQLGGVEFVTYPERTDAYAALVAGDVDVLSDIPTENLASVESDLGERFRQVPSAAFQFLAFPSYQPEFADPEIRRAISMAIDRDEIATGIFRDTETAARSFVAPVVPGTRPDTCGESCRFNPETARDRYAQAGGPPELTISYNTDGGHQAWVEATCDQLAAHLGVECAAAAAPTLADLLGRLENQEPVGILRLSWAMDYPSMESYLGPIYSTRGSANVYGYSNPQFDALVAGGAAAGSPEEALAAYQRAEEILARDLPVIPLRFGQHTIGHSPEVSGIAMTRMGQLDLTSLEITD